MTIKKAYVEVLELLEANKNKKVSTILDELTILCSAKVASSTCIRDEDNNVIAIFCYYHKQWELVADVVYGKKASTATGFNTMCKVGTSKWTKQQSIAKKANNELLTLLAEEEIKPSDIKPMQADIEAKRVAIDATDMPVGFASEADIPVSK